MYIVQMMQYERSKYRSYLIDCWFLRII